MAATELLSDSLGNDEWQWISSASIADLIQNEPNKVTNILLETKEKANDATNWTDANIDALKIFVLKRAPRLFALLVYSGCVQLLDLFYSNDLDDDTFPIKLEVQPKGKRVDGGKLPTWIISSTKKENKVSYEGKEVKRKDAEAMCGFWQWRFFVPIFKEESAIYIFDKNIRMPFLGEVTEGKLKKTNNSIVRHYVIHRSHLSFPGNRQIGDMVDEDGNPHVAVKELLRAHGLTAEEFGQVAKSETDALVRFQKQGHPHLIKAIAYYTQEKQHFFIFPWAKGGNLRDFWLTQPSLSTASLNFSSQDWIRYLKWFFDQLVGLTEAIKCLHYPDNPVDHCRHGDLKPENILCFGTQDLGSTNIPTGVKLIVADAGLARVHEKATQLRGQTMAVSGGTRMYSPPEAEQQRTHATSRRYDVWSLGCMYLEFLIWILYGNDVLERFRNTVGLDEPYYQTQPALAIKSVVGQCIKAIRDDPRCSPATMGPTALGRLVDLIESRLLVMKVIISDNDTTANLDPSDPNEISSDSDDTPIPDQSWKGDGTSPYVRKPTFHAIVRSPTMITPTETTDPERANAIEMLDEIERIYQAAQEGTLGWIHWDGVEEAARLNSPPIVLHLRSLPKTGSEGTLTRSKYQLTAGRMDVRYYPETNAEQLLTMLLGPLRK